VPTKPKTEEDYFIPPSNLEAEEACLGSLLIDTEALHDVAYFLKPEHFYRVTNGWIYEAIIKLSNAGTPVDMITLTTDLRNSEKLEEIGGESYIIGLINTVPTSVNVLQYAQLVLEKAKRRALINAGTKIANYALDEDMPIDEAIAKSESALYLVALAEEGNQATEHISKVVSRHMDRMEMLNKDGKSHVITTGLTDLNMLLSGGFERGSLILVAGDTGMGKSSLLRHFIFAAAKNGASGAYFSLEMPSIQLLQRQISADTRIPVVRYKMGDIQEADWPNYYEHAGKLSELFVDLDDSGVLTPSLITSKCRRIKMQRGLDIIAVDYMALMTADEKTQTETLRLASLSRGLKILAIELNIVVLVAIQLNSKMIATRQDKRPLMPDVRNSSDPNADSDIVLLLYRDEYYNPDTSERPNIAEITIAKNRDGHTGVVDAYWRGELLSFSNLQRVQLAL
jgi:replicative DNA helicase